MSVPTAPIFLPPITFLMSDHTTASLSIEVAEALSLRNASLYVDDFLSPIYNGLQGMFELNWMRDLADPKETNRLMLESITGEATEQDILVSLERWFIDTFGELQLGRMGLHRMKTNREMFAYPYLFRDATPKHLQPFIADPSIPRRDMLIVWLTSNLATSPSIFDAKSISFATPPSVDVVVGAINEAAR